MEALVNLSSTSAKEFIYQQIHGSGQIFVLFVKQTRQGGFLHVNLANSISTMAKLFLSAA